MRQIPVTCWTLVADGVNMCETVQGHRRCVKHVWPQGWFALARPKLRSVSWLGSLTEDKRDATGTHYRRNRYYDPGSGRFTQEDPIGLAGGLNLWGLAEGDPVSFSDPYGLCPQLWRKKCRQATSRLTMGDLLLHGGLAAVAASGNNRHARRAQLILAVTGQVRSHASDLVEARLEDDQGYWTGDRTNAFRHIYGSCQLTRHLGSTTASIVTNAHEAPLRSGDADQERDSNADRQNNATGVKAAEAPQHTGRSCEEIADAHVAGGDYASRH